MINQYMAIRPYLGLLWNNKKRAPTTVIGASKQRYRFLKRLKISLKSTF